MKMLLTLNNIEEVANMLRNFLCTSQAFMLHTIPFGFPPKIGETKAYGIVVKDAWAKGHKKIEIAFAGSTASITTELALGVSPYVDFTASDTPVASFMEADTVSIGHRVPLGGMAYLKFIKEEAWRKKHPTMK